MPTILRVRGLRITIHFNDHWPPHVHVIGPDGQARVALGDACDKPSLMSNDGLSGSDVAIAQAEIERNCQLLRLRWSEIHGDC